MRRRAYTIKEVGVALLVVSLLGAIGVPTYLTLVQRSHNEAAIRSTYAYLEHVSDHDGFDTAGRTGRYDDVDVVFAGNAMAGNGNVDWSVTSLPSSAYGTLSVATDESQRVVAAAMWTGAEQCVVGFQTQGGVPNVSVDETLTAATCSGEEALTAAGYTASNPNDTTPPSAPTDVRATQYATTWKSARDDLRISWTANDADVASYTLYHCYGMGCTPQELTDVAARAVEVATRIDTYIHLDQDEGWHTYQVTATDLAGNTSTLSAPFTFYVDLTTTAAPSNLTATVSDLNGAYGPDDVTLEWPEVTDADLDSYAVAYCEGAGCTPETFVATLTSTGAATESYDHLDRPDGTLRWRVYAIDVAGNYSPPSPTAELTLAVPPAAPTSLTATATERDADGSADDVELDWADSPERDYAYTEVWRCAESTAGVGCDPLTGTLVASPTDSFHLDADLTQDTYNWAVRAVDTSGHRSPATTVSLFVDSPPRAPATITATVVDANANSYANDVRLDWADPHPVDFDVTGYEVWRCSERAAGAGCDPLAAGSLIATPTASAYDDVGLVDDTYRYAVRAVDATGLRGATANANATVALAPSTPSPLSVVAGDYSTGTTQDDVRVDWPDEGNPQGDFARYDVWRCSDRVEGTGCDPRAQGTRVASITTITASVHTDIGLAEDTWHYTVVVYDVWGHASAASGTATVDIPPSTPTGYSATAGNYDTDTYADDVRLVWTSNPEWDLAGYRIRRNGSVIATVGATATSWTGYNVPNYTHTYSVEAYDAGGQTSPRASQSVTHAYPMTVSDNFDRAAGTALGTTSSGNATWQVLYGSWSIQSYRAYTSTAHSYNPVAVVQTFEANPVASVNVGPGDAVYIRVTDSNNWIRARYRRFTVSHTHSWSHWHDGFWHTHTSWHAHNPDHSHLGNDNHSTSSHCNGSTIINCYRGFDTWVWMDGYLGSAACVPTYHDHTGTHYLSSYVKETYSNNSQNRCIYDWFKARYYYGFDHQHSSNHWHDGYYHTHYYDETHTDHYVYLEQSVGGTISTLGSAFIGRDITGPSRLTVDANSSTVSVRTNLSSTNVISASTTFNQTATRHGVGRGYSEHNSNVLDNFSSVRR